MRLQPVMCPGVKLLRRGRESWRNGFVELVPPLAVASVCRVRPVPVVVGVKHQLLFLKVVCNLVSFSSTSPFVRLHTAHS